MLNSFEARHKVSAYSRVLASNLNDGQRFLFAEIGKAWGQLLATETLAAYRAGSVNGRRNREDAPLRRVASSKVISTF